MSILKADLRPVLAAAGALALAVAMVTAALLTTVEHRVVLDGSNNRFDLVAAASAEPDWVPLASDWRDAATEPIVLDLEGADTLQRGEYIDFAVAVKNDGPLDGDLTLRINDADATTDAEPTFFQQLHFTVGDRQQILLDGPIDTFSHTWSEFGQGEVRILTVRVTLPADLPAEWDSQSTRIRIQFEGTNL
ncbi:hypothetical protein HCX50_04045 [Microbacterium oxydans]|uniref:hypothetical protein n=1 Tax=Microbacterium sp. B19(2022) TaxID=2914045 RepID=UPI0014307F7E|nr:hypothetical protein [Microbacterium sp. B19(2022)]NJI58598.1 hypothetical protein [Microbacterium sp. B19(2022)]